MIGSYSQPSFFFEVRSGSVFNIHRIIGCGVAGDYVRLWIAASANGRTLDIYDDER